MEKHVKTDVILNVLLLMFEENCTVFLLPYIITNFKRIKKG